MKISKKTKTSLTIGGVVVMATVMAWSGNIRTKGSIELSMQNAEHRGWIYPVYM